MKKNKDKYSSQKKYLKTKEGKKALRKAGAKYDAEDPERRRKQNVNKRGLESFN